MQQGNRNAVLVVEGIKGPADIQLVGTNEPIKAGIWIESIVHHAQQHGTEMAAADGAEGQRNRQIELSPISIVRTADSATTAIFNSMLTARRFPEMRIVLLRPSETPGKRLPYFSIIIKHAAFRSQSFQASGSGVIQISESIEIVYNTIQYKYTDETWVPGSNQGTYESAVWDQRAHAMV